MDVHAPVTRSQRHRPQATRAEAQSRDETLAPRPPDPGDALLEKERLHCLGLMAARLMHDLRNPLSVVVGSNDVIELSVDEIDRASDSSDIRRSVGDIRQQLALSRAAVGELLELSDSLDDSREWREDAQPVNLHAVVRRSFLRLGVLLRRRTTIDLQAKDDLPPVHGNRSHLTLVVSSLLFNAWEALPEGRGENLITLRLQRRERHALLEVEDNGAGIDTVMLERIFEPYFTTKSHSGSGLGLAVTKSIVEGIGGAIAVQSDLGRGSCFSVLLPYA